MRLDPEKQIILQNNKSKYLDDMAKERKELCHYTDKVSVIEDIISCQRIKATCLKNLPDISEQNAVGKKYARSIFSFSFSHEENPSQEMWNSFGNNHHGFRICFMYDCDFISKLIDRTRPIEAYSSDTFIRAYDYSFNGCPNFCCNDDIASHVFAECTLTDVNYKNNKLKDESIFFINKERYSIINVASKTVKEKYQFQKETRLIAYLRTTKLIDVEKIDYLYIPINFLHINKVEILCGNKVDEKEIKRLHEICVSQCKTEYTIIKED